MTSDEHTPPCGHPSQEGIFVCARKNRDGYAAKVPSGEGWPKAGVCSLESRIATATP
jgi:hypothetical protein